MPDATESAPTRRSRRQSAPSAPAATPPTRRSARASATPTVSVSTDAPPSRRASRAKADSFEQAVNALREHQKPARLQPHMPRSMHQAQHPHPASSEHSHRVSGRMAKRAAAATASIGAMAVVGLLLVSLTTPPQAVASGQVVEPTAGTGVPAQASAPTQAAGDVIGAADEVQAYVAPSDVEPHDLDRPGGYAAASIQQLAAESGVRNFSNFFTNDPNSAIQWPFRVGVPISYGFGIRSGRMHEGADFTPGLGSPINAIADGVVREATEGGGGYGVVVVIDHEIDGQLVSSRYAHMEYGSLMVQEGQKVKVGQPLGLTGNTGHSFGAHLHFEILENGTTAVDPIAWLRAHAGG